MGKPDAYAGSQELSLVGFLAEIKFFEPNCGKHVHFWYATQSFTDGSNVLVHTNFGRPVMLLDALDSCVYTDEPWTRESRLTIWKVHIVPREMLAERVYKKEFTDAFRQRRTTSTDTPAEPG